MKNKQYGFYIDTSKCTGCNTCRIACKDFYDLDLGVNFRRVNEYEGGNWAKTREGWHPDIFAYYVSISCNHCEQPACTKACPTGAMHKRNEDGLVVVDQSVCIGCRYCEMACPYGAPQFDANKKVMSKCDGCFERIPLGRKPICVEACPMRAIEFDTVENLRAKYGVLAGIAPLPSPEKTKPSLVIGSNRKARPCGDNSGNLQNKLEV